MKKLFIISLFSLLSLLSINRAFASVTISEIMYDPDGSDTNREWVELYNDGSSSVDLSGWKFVEANTNHGLTSYSGGASISAGSYAIIALDPATFSSEWSAGSVPIFDASFSLGNTTGESLSLKNSAGEIVFTVTYDPTLGASDDANSLQKYSGSWVAADPTPGKTNSNKDAEGSNDDTGGGNTDDDDEDNTNEDDTTSESGAQELTDEKVEIYDEWQLALTAPSYGVVGSPSTFTTVVENLFGNTVRPGRYVWNMGDGTIYDGTQYQNVTHTYEYSGDYVIVLDYWRSGSSEKEVSVRHTFSVKPSTMTIAALVTPTGMLDAKLTNTTANEIDLSGWQLLTTTHFYNIPTGTIILANKSLTFTSRSTGFVAAEESSLRLVDPSGNTIASTIKVPPPVHVVSKTLSVPPVTIVPATMQQTAAPTVDVSAIQVPSDILTAQAALVPETSKSYLSWFLLAGLIVLGTGSIIFLRRTKGQMDEPEARTEAENIQILE